MPEKMTTRTLGEWLSKQPEFDVEVMDKQGITSRITNVLASSDYGCLFEVEETFGGDAEIKKELDDEQEMTMRNQALQHAIISFEHHHDNPPSTEEITARAQLFYVYMGGSQ